MSAKRSDPKLVLPPIPTNTPEGVRVHAIRETILALENLQPEGLQLQDTDSLELAKQLDVPALYIETIYRESLERSACTPKEIEAYVTWRQRLAALGERR